MEEIAKPTAPVDEVKQAIGRLEAHAPRRFTLSNGRWGGLRWEWLLFAFLALFVLFTRFASLDDRPLHHDESLFALYGWQQATSGSYHAGGYVANAADDEPIELAKGDPTHHPLLHGPLQMELLGIVFRLAPLLGLDDQSDSVARILSALCGVGLFFLVFAMRRDLGREGRLLALAALSVSPGIWYYSRFCRNEAPFLLISLAWVLAMARAWRSVRKPGATADLSGPSALFSGGWVVVFCLLSATLVAFKENSLFLLFNVVCFIGLIRAQNALKRYRRGSFEQRSSAPSLFDIARQYPYAWLGGFCLAWFLLEAVYTNGFTWNTSFASMYLDAMRYWTGQHQEHRLYGDYHYYLPLLTLYEPLAVLVLLAATARFFTTRRHAIAGALLLLAVLVGTDIAMVFGPPAESEGGWGGLLKLCHMTKPWHMGLAFGLGWITLYGAWHFLARGRRFRAWLIWWSGLSLLQYSYAGEKVPWVSLHISLPVILLAADVAGDAWRRWRGSGRRGRLLAGALIGLSIFAWGVNARQGWRLCFEHASDPRELLVYNHTQPAIGDLGRILRRAARASGGKRVTLLQGEACWPLLWYLRDYRYLYTEGESPEYADQAEFLVCDQAFSDEYPEISAKFDIELRPFRRAWLPDELYPFTPLSAALRDVYPTSTTLTQEDAWTESDREHMESKRDLYGLGAWRSMAEYALFRRLWGDPAYTAVPEEVCFGIKKPLEASSSIAPELQQ